MIYDVITYNGEKELFDLRYNILKDHVDQFVVVEFDKTFSGRPKKPKFFKDFRQYRLLNNVCFHFMKERDYGKYAQLANDSPQTHGASHWKREFMQKESIKDALLTHHLADEDIVFVGDCDEIWKPFLPPVGITKLKLKVYTYFLNNQSTEEFWGTIATPYKEIKGQCLNHLRMNPTFKTIEQRGWHFTSMSYQLADKLKDSYTEESYATEAVLESLQSNIENDKDFLGRDFKYKVDESHWPQYLKDNKKKYIHLMK